MPCRSCLSRFSLPLRHGSCNNSLFSHGCLPPFIVVLQSRHIAMLLQSWINQRQIRCWIKPLLHRYWIFCNHYFQRRRFVRLENMTALRCSFWTPYQLVSMNYELSLTERDIAAHPNHVVLTVDGNLLVHFALGIEPPQRCSIPMSGIRSLFVNLPKLGRR
jgi:hypothetical protein